MPEPWRWLRLVVWAAAGAVLLWMLQQARG
jgi:hypothetical protein